MIASDPYKQVTKEQNHPNKRQFFSTGLGQKENISRQRDKFNPKQIKETLTLLNERMAQQLYTLKAKAKLAWEKYRLSHVLLQLTYAIEEINAKREDVKITQVLPSSRTFPEAVEVPNTVRRKIM